MHNQFAIDNYHHAPSDTIASSNRIALTIVQKQQNA